MNDRQAFILWLLFLSSIIVATAVIVNFNLGDSQFQIDLANYLANH